MILYAPARCLDYGSGCPLCSDLVITVRHSYPNWSNADDPVLGILSAEGPSPRRGSTRLPSRAHSDTLDTALASPLRPRRGLRRQLCRSALLRLLFLQAHPDIRTRALFVLRPGHHCHQDGDDELWSPAAPGDPRQHVRLEVQKRRELLLRCLPWSLPRMVSLGHHLSSS